MSAERHSRRASVAGMPISWASPPCSPWHRGPHLGGSSRRMAAPRLTSRTVTAGPGCGARVTALLKNRCRRYGRGCRSVQRSDGPGSQIRCRPLCWSGFRTTCQPAGSCRGVAHKRCDADRSVIRHARCGPIWREVRKGAGRGGTLSRNAPPGSCGSPPRGVSGVMAHTTFKARGGFPACAGAGASRLRILPIPSAVQASSPGRRGGWPHSVFLRI